MTYISFHFYQNQDKIITDISQLTSVIIMILLQNSTPDGSPSPSKTIYSNKVQREHHNKIETKFSSASLSSVTFVFSIALKPWILRARIIAYTLSPCYLKLVQVANWGLKDVFVEWIDRGGLCSAGTHI